MLKIQMSELPAMLEFLAKTNSLYLPVKKNNQTDFALWQAQANLDLKTTITAKSLKDIFFPQVENLLAFKTTGKTLAIEPQKLQTEQVIGFGVRACDLQSFNLLDKVFLSEPIDEFYRARRENCLLIAVACTAPEETCFCQSFAIDPLEPQADVATWLIDETLYWRAQTSKGELLTNKLAEFLEQVAETELTSLTIAKQAVRDKFCELPLNKINFSQQLAGLDFEQIFESEIWAQLSATCIGCGTCTYICPTCHCYDIKDAVTKSGIERFRCWDSCMYSDFTNMAHGNPRASKKERFRQRFMHKLVYFPDNQKAFACVGCGRCLQKCPACMNIIKVVKALEVGKNV